MKKLSLNATAFQKGEVLTRSQLKMVIGGNDEGSGEGSGTTTKCRYSCTYELNGTYQTVYSWGGTCKSSSDCDVSNSSCSSYGVPNVTAATCRVKD